MKCKAAEHEYSGKPHLKHMGSVKETYWQIHIVDVDFGGPNCELVQPLKVKLSSWFMADISLCIFATLPSFPVSQPIPNFLSEVGI